MRVAAAPVPWTVMALLMSSCPTYVPAATLIMSPATAASIAAWIVG
jgi:hypothetical protein